MTRAVAGSWRHLGRDLPPSRKLSSLTPLRLDPALESIISSFQSAMKSSRQTHRADKAKALVEDFGQLQRVRVQQVLLVCTDYDSYTFEEDGLLNELVYQWYADHSLSKPPIIDRVSSPQQGIERFKERNYDMVVTLSRLAKQSNLITEIHRHNPATPIGLIALNPSELANLNPQIESSLRLNVNKRLLWETAQAGGDAKGAVAASATSLQDAWVWPFMWQGSPQLFTAMFKAVEDRLNLKHDSEYGVQTIIVVEDSVQFYSSYLPVLYSELWRQNKSVAAETMHTRERMLRMTSRPKIIFCTNYEEALDIYDRYRDNVLGVITDLGFPKDGIHSDKAGLELTAHIKDCSPELPILMQSMQPEDSDYAAVARGLGAKYTCKDSHMLLQSLRDFIHEDLMFGPLKFQDGVTGKPLGQVANVTELMKVWQELPLTSVAYHARHSHLSRWFNARAEFQLAARFRASRYPQDFIDTDGKERPEWLRNWILAEARAHRNKLASTVENAKSADASTPIVRLGNGSLGGKGRGFRFLHNLSDKFNMSTVISDLELVVPRCFILATSCFEDFIEDNDLFRPAMSASTNEEVTKLFDAAPLSPDVSESLREFLQHETGPLAVRSSSLFEDAFMQPFAGIYQTVFLPNASDDLDTRLEQLTWAVKQVYASTYSQEARAYATSQRNRTEEEKMAVILQPLVGEASSDGYFYPTLAGVANSVDFYPLPHTSSAHGCAQLALGLGSGVVDNEEAVHFSLGDTSHLTGSELTSLPVTALNLHAAPGSPAELVVQLSGQTEQALRTVPAAATVAMAPEAARSIAMLSQDVHGEQVVFKKSYGDVVDDAATPPTAAAPSPSAELQSVALPQLLNSEVPIAKALSFLLRLGAAGLGCPVEIEFALKARKEAGARHQLHLLQIRPQAQFQSKQADRFEFLPSSDYAAVASKRALGHGRFENITDVVYVSPERFNKAQTAQIAAEIGQLNRQLQEEGRRYLLMAPGRWGSADATSGIPVQWQDIDHSSFIVETVLDKHVPVSQGSHFFQNIIAFGLGYMTVDPAQQPEVADYAFLDSLPGKAATSFVRHVRLEQPLEIVVDSQSRHGVVMKPGKPFDVYVGQVDAFMALAQEQFNSGA